jgi:crotonobetainyl-CoA:carnitine CoA-transferase CaiB-like acyl-CoA transferase
VDATQTHDLDEQIARLEAELAELKAQRAQQLDGKPKPLDGIRILDMSRFIFGPFCAQMLADMGADVIKLEPLKGDPARGSGNVRVVGDLSPSFLARNRNKRSLAMDMRQPQAQDIARRLALQSDVLLHNFRPGIMSRMGLDAKRLLEMHPRLIYCSLSGYGQSGPLVDWPGQDLLIQAMSGIVAMTGWEDGPPTTVGTYLADMTGALTAAYSIVTALCARYRHGVGQEVEVNLLDSMINLQAMDATVYLNSGDVPPKSRSGHWLLPPPYSVFHTRDKDMVVNAHSDAWWPRLCRAEEFAHLEHDPRFATREARMANRDELTAVLQAMFVTRTREAWLSYLGQFDVLCAPVYDYAELFADPQVQHNGIVAEQHHPVAGPIKVVGIPVKLSVTPGEVRSPAPQLGEHTDEILRELGYDDAHIERLRQEAVITILGS